jgi:hypothetical protein
MREFLTDVKTCGWGAYDRREDVFEKVPHRQFAFIIQKAFWAGYF